jgi:O-antigen/teichoic acid export membrane protein
MRALWRDGAIYAAGTLVTRGLGLLLLPLYTRALPPGPFGLLDLIVTAGVLVNLVVPLETPQAVARFWNERAEGAPRRTLAGTGLVFASAGYAVFLLLAWVLAAPLAAAFGAPGADGVAAVRAGAVFIALNGVMLVLQGQFRWALRPRAHALAGVAYAALVLAGLAALLAAGAASVAAVLWLQAASAGLVALGCALALRGSFALRVDGTELRTLLAFSLPLVPAGVAVFATSYAHRFVLGAWAPLDEVGLFGIASRVAALATLVLIGVQTALTPLVYAHHAEPGTPARLARLAEGFWGAALLACLVLALFGRELLALLATPAYAAAAPLVAWLAPAALLAQMYIFAPGIPIARKTHWQLALTLVAAGLGLALAFALVPRWQALGAALATLAAAAVFFGAWVALGQRLYPLPLRWGPLAGVTLLFGALVGAASLPAMPSGTPVRVAGVALLAAVLWASGLLRWPARAAAQGSSSQPAAGG